MTVFHGMGRFFGSPNLVHSSIAERFGTGDGLQECKRLQDNSQQITWLMDFGHMLFECLVAEFLARPNSAQPTVFLGRDQAAACFTLATTRGQQAEAKQ